MKSVILKFLSTLLIFQLIGCNNNLKNLSESKKRIADYYESGRFDQDIEKIVRDVKNDFDDYQFNQNDAVVFDVDETLLSNYDYAKSVGFGYIYNLWNEWQLDEKSTAIPEMKNLYDWFISNNVKIIFLTGRQFHTYQSTLNNLRKEGFNKSDTLICRNQAESKTPTYQYKTSKREELSENGYNIIATFGDQNEDLLGDFTGLKVKIPNYIYKLD